MPTELYVTGDINDYKIGISTLSNAMVEFGCTADELSEAIQKIASLMKSMECVNARIDYIEDKLSQLEPAPDVKTENPKQKSDLEIFSRIEPSTEFLILGDVGWSEDIIDIDTHNMFLN